MIKGISMAARAMKNQVVRNDVIANNLANVNTVAFKKDVPAFQLEESGGGIETRVLVAVSHAQGPLTRTDRPLDVAIEGDGYFVVETDEGEAYTRRGSFIRDEDGYVITSEGHRVVSSGGALQIGTGDISISREGIIEVDGDEIGRLRIVRFEDKTGLIKTGSSLFTPAGGEVPEDLTEEEVSVLSGFIEESNVEVVSEMTKMIKALKAYEIAQKALKAQDEVLQLTVGKVGSTSGSS